MNDLVKKMMFVSGEVDGLLLRFPPSENKDKAEQKFTEAMHHLADEMDGKQRPKQPATLNGKPSGSISSMNIKTRRDITVI